MSVQKIFKVTWALQRYGDFEFEVTAVANGVLLFFYLPQVVKIPGLKTNRIKTISWRAC